jgi:hypothetical protein
LITRDRAAAIEVLEDLIAEAADLASDAAPQVLSHHLSTLLLKTHRAVKGEDSLGHQISLANQFVALLAESVDQAGIDDSDQLPKPAAQLGQLLRSAWHLAPGCEVPGTGCRGADAAATWSCCWHLVRIGDLR